MNNTKLNFSSYKKIQINNGCLVTPFQEIPGGGLELAGGVITRIEMGTWIKRGGWISLREKADALVIDAGGNYVVPGFIDLHVHGAGGWDVLDGTGGAINSLAQALAGGGTTSFLPTVMTGPEEQMIKSLKAIAISHQLGTDGAKVLGAHLEGPFLSKEKRGIHQECHLFKPSARLLETFLEAAEGLIKILTLAPEVEGALELIELAGAWGILPSAGHTRAKYEEMTAACQAGLKLATHTFNAMEPFHHREPGVVGAVLTMEKIQAEVIPDPFHLHPVALQLLLKAKGLAGVYLVTDSNRAAGLPDGKYNFAGREITLEKGIASSGDGTLAGSVLTMAQGVKNAMVMANLSLCQAVQLATINPARILGLGNYLGSLEVGKRADLVILDPDLNPILTMVDGKIVYRA